MGWLVVTFHGPFAFQIEARSIDVYVPKCDNHHAAVFSVNDEHPLCGRHKLGGEYTYHLEGAGIINNSGPIDFVDGKNWILDGPSGKKVDTSQPSFCINVPRPKKIYPISPAKTEVVKGSPTGTLSEYATGLRFFYECDLSKSVGMYTPEQIHLPLSFENLPSLPDYADVEFRYVGPDADDSEHVDAISCFDQTMKLVNTDWWLNYGQANKLIDTRTGADCRSLALVVGRT